MAGSRSESNPEIITNALTDASEAPSDNAVSSPKRKYESPESGSPSKRPTINLTPTNANVSPLRTNTLRRPGVISNAARRSLSPLLGEQSLLILQAPFAEITSDSNLSQNSPTKSSNTTLLRCPSPQTTFTRCPSPFHEKLPQAPRNLSAFHHVFVEEAPALLPIRQYQQNLMVLANKLREHGFDQFFLRLKTCEATAGWRKSQTGVPIQDPAMIEMAKFQLKLSDKELADLRKDNRRAQGGVFNSIRIYGNGKGQVFYHKLNEVTQANRLLRCSHDGAAESEEISQDQCMFSDAFKSEFPKAGDYIFIMVSDGAMVELRLGTGNHDFAIFDSDENKSIISAGEISFDGEGHIKSVMFKTGRYFVYIKTLFFKQLMNIATKVIPQLIDLEILSCSNQSARDTETYILSKERYAQQEDRLLESLFGSKAKDDDFVKMYYQFLGDLYACITKPQETKHLAEKISGVNKKISQRNHDITVMNIENSSKGKEEIALLEPFTGSTQEYANEIFDLSNRILTLLTQQFDLIKNPATANQRVKSFGDFTEREQLIYESYFLNDECFAKLFFAYQKTLFTAYIGETNVDENGKYIERSNTVSETIIDEGGKSVEQQKQYIPYLTQGVFKEYDGDNVELYRTKINEGNYYTISPSDLVIFDAAVDRLPPVERESFLQFKNQKLNAVTTTTSSSAPHLMSDASLTLVSVAAQVSPPQPVEVSTPGVAANLGLFSPTSRPFNTPNGGTPPVFRTNSVWKKPGQHGQE